MVEIVLCTVDDDDEGVVFWIDCVHLLSPFELN